MNYERIRIRPSTLHRTNLTDRLPSGNAGRFCHFGLVRNSTEGKLVADTKSHHIKCVNPYFDDIWDRKKAFEYRRNDRGYALGDTLYIYEFSKNNSEFSGRRIICTVTSVFFLVDHKGDDMIIMSLSTGRTSDLISWATSEYRDNQPKAVA